MASQYPEPIVVARNAAFMDTAQAALRYLTVVLLAFPTISALISKGDVLGLIAFFQANEGLAVVGAVVALGTIGYGLWKTSKRAAQLVTVAADREVHVAKLSS